MNFDLTNFLSYIYIIMDTIVYVMMVLGHKCGVTHIEILCSKMKVTYVMK